MSKYLIKYSGRFKKSYKRCIKRGCDPELFQTVVKILSDTGSLPAEYKPHILHGNYEGFWECHITPDWLLVWLQNDNELILTLTDTGTHSDLF